MARNAAGHSLRPPVARSAIPRPTASGARPSTPTPPKRPEARPAAAVRPRVLHCHATGWNPNEFVSLCWAAFDSLDQNAAAGRQLLRELPRPGRRPRRRRARSRRTTRASVTPKTGHEITAAFAKENVFTKCHDHDNSPEFNNPPRSNRSIGQRWSTRERGRGRFGKSAATAD